MTIDPNAGGMTNSGLLVARDGARMTLNTADYERTVKTLLSGGSDPVITKAPEGAWTHDITDKAL